MDVNHRLARTIRLIETFIEDGEFQGAGVAFWRAGETIQEWYAGAAGPDLPAGPDVLWPLASISKLHTSAAILSLVESGRLTLSMRVSDVIPEFDSDQRRNTRLWHLLTHTSGLIYESPDMEQRLADETPLGPMIDEAFSHPLLSAPGDRFEYSDYGIALAACVAETICERPFAELVHDLVLKPADLNETYFPPPPCVHQRIARISSVPASGTSGEMYNSSYCRELAHPSFGVVSSVRDLLRFGLLFSPGADTTILSPATVQLMTTDQLSGGRRGALVGTELTLPQPWGLGFMVRGGSLQFGFGELASPSAFGHAGASGCVLIVDPVNDFAFAIVTNRHAASGFERFLFREAAMSNAVVADLTSEN
jgi:CubicO group peptidase (beta-lactamase class C family)